MIVERLQFKVSVCDVTHGPSFGLLQTFNKMFCLCCFRERPLALYAFTNNSELQERLSSEIQSGGYVINDIIAHYGSKSKFIQLWCSTFSFNFFKFWSSSNFFKYVQLFHSFFLIFSHVFNFFIQLFQHFQMCTNFFIQLNSVQTFHSTFYHLSVNTLPFGGIGNSGMGAYHGKYSFDAFSHSKAYLNKNQSMEFLHS